MHKEDWRLATQHGLLHLEADISLDRCCRSSECPESIGTGAMIIHTDGNISGIRRDDPHAKPGNPAWILQQHGLTR